MPRPVERVAAERELREALEPPRITLLRQFNALPEGVKFLVDRRAELLELGRHDALLRGLADDLRRLLANWFDIGFLELQRIGWESPAALLEKLMAYEAVHEIRSWADLKNRLEVDRRCFAFFHPRMPDEPLIFVEVALVRAWRATSRAARRVGADRRSAGRRHRDLLFDLELPAGAQRDQLWRFPDQARRRCACRRSAAAEDFATLSPVPGFRAWLDRHSEARGGLLLPAERNALEALGDGDLGARSAGAARSPRLARRRRSCPRRCASLCCDCARAIWSESARRPAARSTRSRISTSATARVSSA